MIELDETHDPMRRSWVPDADGHPDFPIQNLPFGMFSPLDAEPRIGVAIGDHILDLRHIGDHLPHEISGALGDRTLNGLLARSHVDLLALRRRLSALLADSTKQAGIASALHLTSNCRLHLPFAIGDYTDFYVGIHHALNIGRQFRPDHPLLPNYKHVPIGYHGRASSVRPSGESVVRPNGQRKQADDRIPSYGPARRLDYELELGVWIGEGNDLGEPVPIAEAADHIAGFCLLNDWSARDIQGWEYQPLGPFLAKSFHTTVSPWVVTPAALAPFRGRQPARPAGDPLPLPYLWDDADQEAGGLGLTLDVHMTTAAMREGGLPARRLSHGDTSAMYWTVAQMLTHHASNGCNLRSGDLLGTGTLSMPERNGYGSLAELTLGGAEEFELSTGERRTFLEDGDEIIITARAERDGWIGIGFGECRATILGAREA